MSFGSERYVEIHPEPTAPSRQRKPNPHSKGRGGIPVYANNYRRWNHDDDVHLIDLLEDGAQRSMIARWMRRTPDSLRNRIRYLREQGRLQETEVPLSVADICRLLGYHPGERMRRETIYRWIESKALPAHIPNYGYAASARSSARRQDRLGTPTAPLLPPRRLYRVVPADLWEFLSERQDYWREWDPFLVTRDDWRDELIELRGMTHHAPTDEIVRLYGIPKKTIEHQRKHRRLPGIVLGRVLYLDKRVVEAFDWTATQPAPREGPRSLYLQHPPKGTSHAPQSSRHRGSFIWKGASAADAQNRSQTLAPTAPRRDSSDAEGLVAPRSVQGYPAERTDSRPGDR